MKRARAWKMILAIAAVSLACGTQAGANATGSQPQQDLGKPSLWSNVDVQFYGYIKADASYDDSRVTTGNYVVWADRENARDDDDEFNLTANETRLGLALTGPKTSGMVTTGKVEFDFFGNYATENKAKIQMRHAYLQVYWPDRELSILAGQTWDVISPLNPTTLNYTVLWDVGNIGYRRPQMRITKELIAVAPQTKLKFEGAISRTIGQDVLGDGGPSESGEDVGFPTLQGRIGLTFPWLDAGATTVGVSGHWGKEEYDTTAGGAHGDFDTWSINFDVLQPVCPKVTVKAEVFAGENLGSFFGGIGQTVRVSDPNNITSANANEIAARGGWCAATLGPWDDLTFNVGFGLDDVDSSDVANGSRIFNRCIFGNAIYALNERVDVGVELSHWRTDYKGSGDADDVRLQGAFKYKF